MLFSSPDYPLFLIAVFFLYALARWGEGARGAAARLALMVLLGDVVFMLVAKDPDTLWDPIGGTLLRIAANDGRGWPAWLVAHWAIGGAALAGAIVTGRRYAAWIASEPGQARIALGIVAALATLAVVVALASWQGVLDEVTAQIVAHGHLVVLGVLGIGLGASQTSVDVVTSRSLASLTPADPARSLASVTTGAQRPLGRVIVLFVASSLFYHAWASAMPGVYRYLLGVLLCTIVLDYYLGLWIERTEDPGKRKALLIVSLCSNLGILFFFKYADFFTHDVLQLDVERLDLILPAGISFHTFQSLSYTIDVYRKKLPATRSVVEFATFVLFFPQLVAGPIVRAQDLLPQLAKPPPLELQKATAGLFRIVIGLFKKIALADALALSIVDRVFEAPERFSSLEVMAGVYGYALQIYLDFSAYSDIAIGSAMILGFSLPENFRTPYRSASLQEFWRRWHISLSTWLRDYLYVTLGGNRGAAWRTYVNLSLTMLLGGLWHGASWTFVVWGALHGFGLAITRYFQRTTEAWRVFATCVAIAIVGVTIHTFLWHGGVWSQLVLAWLYLTPLWAVVTAWLGRDELPDDEPPPARHPRWRAALALRFAMCAAGIAVFVALQLGESWTWIATIVLAWALALSADIVERGGIPALALLRRALAVVLVFHYVCLAWIFFRATSFDNALAILRQLAALETDHANLVALVTTALAAGFACHFFADGSFRWLRERFVALPAWAHGALLAAAALALRELGQTKIVPFIYFQF